MISYIIPTRDRPRVLTQTLRAIGNLPPHEAEVVIIDNASATPIAPLLADPHGDLPDGRLQNGIAVRTIRSEINLGAAGRNLAAHATPRSAQWLVMLDDDSWPTDLGFLDAIREAPSNVAAIAGEIHLLNGMREAGGLPEVFTGCGAIIRRDAFIAAGGYDQSFGYYAEEYDLAARFILAGLRISTDRRARFVHAKVQSGRDMNTILARLVRNNGWVMQRYAPDALRRRALRDTVDRYERIARKEFATEGYAEGFRELLRTLRAQPRTPMTLRQWERFTGKSAARRALLRAWATHASGGGGGGARTAGFSTVKLIDEGKNCDVIREVLDDLGIRITADDRAAEAVVIGTLSPGPMWDAAERRHAESTSDARPTLSPLPVIVPWKADNEMHNLPRIVPGIAQRCA